MISVKAPSPVMLQAVPKLSCKAKMVSRRAVPASSNPSMEITIPREAMTVPPGTPGAPMAKMPSRMMNRIGSRIWLKSESMLTNHAERPIMGANRKA